jgi:hypothetical protein
MWTTGYYWKMLTSSVLYLTAYLPDNPLHNLQSQTTVIHLPAPAFFAVFNIVLHIVTQLLAVISNRGIISIFHRHTTRIPVFKRHRMHLKLKSISATMSG